MPNEVPLTVSEPELVVTFELLYISMPVALFVPFAAFPVIAKLPASVAEMLADEVRKTPLEFAPVPFEVPSTVSEPDVVTQDPLIIIPKASVVPFAAVPVIVTLPALVAEILAEENRRMPYDFVPVPHAVPLTVSEPEVVVTQD